MNNLKGIYKEKYTIETQQQTDFINDRNNHFKINLPNIKRSYLSGNGEGCFCIPLTIEDKRKMKDDNSICEKFKFILMNDSMYYPELKHLDILEGKTQGKYRPILFIPEFEKELIL